MKNLNTIPLNLQFFADGNPTDPEGSVAAGAAGAGNQQAAPTQQATANDDKTADVTLESVLAQMAELKATNAKLKADYDKLCTSEGNLRKQLRAKQTAEEQEAEAKAEQKQQHDEYVAGLEKFKAVTLAIERYADSYGMPKELARATAQAEVDGDKDTVDSNIKRYWKEREEVLDKEIHAKYAAQMPIPQSGNSGTVDYSAEINKAINDGDLRSATLAILQQAQANKPNA